MAFNIYKSLTINYSNINVKIQHCELKLIINWTEAIMFSQWNNESRKNWQCNGLINLMKLRSLPVKWHHLYDWHVKSGQDPILLFTVTFSLQQVSVIPQQPDQQEGAIKPPPSPKMVASAGKSCFCSALARKESHKNHATLLLDQWSSKCVKWSPGGDDGRAWENKFLGLLGMCPAGNGSSSLKEFRNQVF